MKDILKSKVMIGFIIFVLGFTYLNASLENKKSDSSELVEQMSHVSKFEK